MTVGDREYFLLRACQERAAVLCTGGEVRRRHEELASAYEMRITYIDRGMIGDDEPAAEVVPMPISIVA